VLDLIVKKIKSCESAVIAIDGPSGSGKSTLTAEIAKTIDCNVIHADDFFLQAGQDMPLPDINLDVIRLEEAIRSLVSNFLPVTYSKYDCMTKTLTPITLIPKKVTLIEGCYSASPNLLKYYNFFVFLDIDRRLQLERIKARAPDKYENFITRWIPQEDRYFKSYQLREAAKKNNNLFLQT